MRNRRIIVLATAALALVTGIAVSRPALADTLTTITLTATGTTNCSPACSGDGINYQATVTPDSGSTTPTGSVQFALTETDANTVIAFPCDASSDTVALTDGTATCHVEPVLAHLSPYRMTATYLPDPGFAPTEPASDETTVAKGPVHLAQATSRAQAFYGHEQGTHLALTFDQRVPDSGTVTFGADSKSLCTATLGKSAVRCTMTKSRLLTPGRYDVTATYSGSADYLSSGPTTIERLRVFRELTTTTLRARRHGPAVRARVKVTPKDGGQARGRVIVRSGTASCVVHLRRSRGACTLKHPSKPWAKATYRGSKLLAVSSAEAKIT